MSSSISNYDFNIYERQNINFSTTCMKNAPVLCFMKCMLQNTSQHCRLNEIYYVSIIRRTTEHFLCSFLQTLVCPMKLFSHNFVILFLFVFLCPHFSFSLHTILNANFYSCYDIKAYELNAFF